MGTDLGSHISSLTSLVLSPFSGIPVHLHAISTAGGLFSGQLPLPQTPASFFKLLLLPPLLEINLQREARQSLGQKLLRADAAAFCWDTA